MDSYEIACEAFTATRQDNIAVLRFCRHFLLRTANLRDRDRALDFLDRLSADDAVKALLVIGAPDAKGREEFLDFFRNFFASGMDIKLVHRMYNVISQLVLRLAKLNKSVVYVNSGNVLASFLNIGLACDYRILADNAIIQNPCTEKGLVPKGGGAYFLPKIIGPARTYEIMLSDRDISAAEARELGIVNEVIPIGDLEEKAFARAREFAQKPLPALTTLKKLIGFSYKDLQDYMEYEDEILIHSMRLADFSEVLH